MKKNKNIYIVYCHTHKEKNKKYIGYTKYSLKKRWAGHVQSAKYGSKLYFHRVIRKYGSGEDVWIHEILESNLSFEDALKLEIESISKYKSHNPKFGYNLTLGGKGTVSTSNTKKNQSKARRRKIFGLGPIVSFKKAKLKVEGLKIKTIIDYNFYIKNNPDSGLPTRPDIAYKTKWKSWYDYFGLDYSTKFLNWEEAKQKVKNLSLLGHIQYRDYVRNNIVERLPISPEEVYKEWIDWYDFLGLDRDEAIKKKSAKGGNSRRKNAGMAPIIGWAEAKEELKKLFLKSVKDYYSYISSTPNCPFAKSPHKYYKEWTSWKDYLNLRSPILLSFEEAKKIVQSLQIKSVRQYIALRKKNKLFSLPYEPNMYYDNKGWLGWKDFGGTTESQ